MIDKEIELEAYYLWEKAGKPENLSEFFWHVAKERVESRGRILYSDVPYRKQMATWKMNDPTEELTRIMLDEYHKEFGF